MASVTAPTRKSAEDPPPAREAPAPDVSLRATADVAHKSLPDEQVLRVTEIQGNILAGFTKDYQALLFLQIEDVRSFRGWLGSQVPYRN